MIGVGFGVIMRRLEVDWQVSGGFGKNGRFIQLDLRIILTLRGFKLDWRFIDMDLGATMIIRRLETDGNNFTLLDCMDIMLIISYIVIGWGLWTDRSNFLFLKFGLCFFYLNNLFVTHLFFFHIFTFSNQMFFVNACTALFIILYFTNSVDYKRF